MTELARSPLQPVFSLLLCLLLAAACDENPVRPIPVGEQFVLAPGETVSIAGTMIRMRFEAVANDSRCALDAICIQAGDAVVVITVLDEVRSSRYELAVNQASRKSVTHRNVRIEVVELQPYPISSRPADPAAYRATFKVDAV
jgi:hypothetical protein